MRNQSVSWNYGLLLLLGGIVASSDLHAEQIHYTYQIVTQSGDQFGSQGVGSGFQEFDLNDQGVVAANVFSGGFGSASWVLKYNTNTQTGQVVSQIGDTIGGDTIAGGGAAGLQINNSGQMVFQTNINGSVSALISNTNGSSSVVFKNGQTVNGKAIGLLGGTLNDSGEIVFNGQNAQVVGSVHSTTRGLLLDGASSPHNPRRGRPHLNNNGDVIAGATTTFPGVDMYSSAVKVGQGVSVVAHGRTLRNRSGTNHGGTELFGGPTAPIINDSGEAVFYGTVREGQVSRFALFTTNGVVAVAEQTVDGKTLASNAFQPNSFRTTYDMNNQGDVAWVDHLDLGGSGVFVGTQNLAATGDLVQGQSVSGIAVTDVAINNSGQVLFEASLGNGLTKALVLASPIVQEFVAAFTAGSPAILNQTIAQSLGSGTLPLSFDYLFESLSGTLQIFLDGTLLDTINSPPTLQPGMTTHNLLVDASLFPGNNHLLQFHYDGPTGSRLLLDNVSFLGIQNGDFQTGLLAPWVLDQGTEGTVHVEALNSSAVPEPSAMLLAMIFAVACLCLRFRKIGFLR